MTGINTKKVLVAALVFSVIAWGLIIGAKIVRASCDPPECGEPFLDCSGWGSNYHCLAKCCVPNDGGATPTPTPTPGPGATPTPGGGNDPKGWHDDTNNSSCTTWGWTCDADSYNTALTVKFYSDSAKTNYISETIANQTREQAVADSCGGYANHGFNSTLPAGTSGNIYAYAINTGGGSDKLLSGSPKTISCPASTPTPTHLPCPSGFGVSCTGSGAQATISWDALAGAAGYVLRVNKDPYGDWFGTGDIWEEPVNPSQTINIVPDTNYTYDVQGKKPGEVYPYSGLRCPFDVFNCPAPTCSVILSPGLASVEIGKTQLYTATVYPDSPSATVDRVDFSSGDTGVATVDPASDLTSAYQTTAKGENAGPTLIEANVFLGGGSTCPDTANITVTNPGPWWQVDSGNIHADNGNVGSSIPSTAAKPYLITGGLTGLVPGLVSYTGSLDVGNAVAINQAGLSNWQAQTSYQGLKTDYGYFKRILEDDPEAAANGVTIHEGDYVTDGEISVVDGENMIILVNGEVTISANINVDPGGFLAIISSGNITIGDSVTNIEGVYVADGIISSGTSESQLIGEGIFTGWGGISLQRDFG